MMSHQVQQILDVLIQFSVTARWKTLFYAPPRTAPEVIKIIILVVHTPISRINGETNGVLVARWRLNIR
jgi:hypothetical protein